VIWAVRGLLLGALVLVGGLALAAAQQQPVSQSASVPTAPAPLTGTPQPTRAPTLVLPSAPERIVSRISRATSTPATRPTPGGLPEVAVVDYGYQPGVLRVPLNAVVKWTNRGDEGHDVTGDGPGGVWRSGPLAQGESYQRQFALPGEYPYVCTVHPEMRGFVVVQP
jgi:plastocyanin